jgi:glycosyltransferase involved in cell wall biosynthesis
MTFGLELLGAFTVIEFALRVPLFWRARKVLSVIMMAGLLVSAVIVVAERPGTLSYFLASLSMYRIVSLARIIKGQMPDGYLRRTLYRTTNWLVAAQGFVLVSWKVFDIAHISLSVLWYSLGIIQLIAAITVILSMVRHLRTTWPPELTLALSDHDLPALTVAIPARNETEDLEACLRSLIASDYPKLEILVLDDCSQNKRTPEIIRSFAHDGVRFIKGVEPTTGWLAKNQAYQRLYEEANGELILFCGVDSRYTSSSLRKIVLTLIQKHKTMMSIIPRNDSPSLRDSLALCIQPIRYAWELALPRRIFYRPPVLSTCWIIRRTVLESAGGFAAVSRSIVPESYFARVAIVHDGYSFMQSNETVDVVSAKRVSEQLATAIRTRYPQVHRHLELAAFVTLIEIVGVLIPLLLAFQGRPRIPEVLWLSSIVVTLSYVLVYSLIVRLTYHSFVWRSLVGLPFAILTDLYLLNRSMLQYEFSEVNWKGRNVCIPVMRIDADQPPATPLN